MTTDSFIASTTQFQTLLIALVLIVAVIYFFIELRRIDNRISNLEVSVKKIFTDKETQLVAVKEAQLSPDQGFSVINPAVDQSIMEPTEEEVITNDITPLLTEVERSDDTKVTDVIVDVADVANVVEDVVEDVVDVVEDVEDVVVEDVEDVVEDVVDDVVEDVEDVEDVVVEDVEDVEDIDDEEDVVDVEDVEDIVDDAVVDDAVVDDAVVDDVVDDVVVEDVVAEDVDVGEVEDKDKSMDFIFDSQLSGYDNMTIKELKDILSNMNLPTSGNKTKLIQRIVINEK